ncbi:hypothetical protein L6164_020473 [Bauhinia variegata]|uniref:Uncharacterized protein n=1 Tax=Bauhinia variegata TaxID=167791 RepID=A0ACB9MVL9_BAUVA|nr:hypothetical protein L6164_020473 [Bauhinia variegata]
MGTLIDTVIRIPSPRRVPKPRTAPRKAITARPLSCLRNNGDLNGLGDQWLEGSNNVEISKSSNGDQDVKRDDIWQLFREAQQNILYLNKQRVTAIEELNKTNREKQKLLKRIEKLEAEKKAAAGKDNLSICWELLLRIDSMVLTSMINPGEGSELRSLVMNHKVSVADVFTDIRQRRDSDLLGELHHFSDSIKKNGFHIVHICTEMAPLVSRGSVASYVTGISRALQRKGHLVEVILPKYACLDLNDIQGLREVKAEAYSYFNGQLHGNRIWTGVVCGIGVTLIEPLYYSPFFSREKIYGYSDDFERFSYFSRASLDYIVKSGKQPDVLHLHNWETAIVGPLFWDIFVEQGLEGTKILLTCHDVNSQCIEQPAKLALCGLDPARLHRLDRLQDNSNTDLVNILKGGVVYSNGVIIMPSMHSKHRIDRRLGHGLEPTLNVHRGKLAIAPYGIDKLTWDPSTDHFLPENFSAENLDGKAVCKVALQQRLGLSEHASITLVGCIFSEGTDLDMKYVEVISNTAQQNVQFVFMGTPEIINQARESLGEELKDENIKFILTDDEALSHLLFAGSDIILCRSIHDHADEVPLKALRYGAAPIAVVPDASTYRDLINHDNQTTKYSQFMNSTFGNMSLNLAIDEIRTNPSKWKRRIMEAMAQDFSWDAECYDIHVSVYAAIKNL